MAIPPTYIASDTGEATTGTDTENDDALLAVRRVVDTRTVSGGSDRRVGAG
ncbi:hypothetical protein [Halorubrum coriense]|uniref:hypothetical protein n=1 Tax=Halorubrum coriense TaxID=64713 RepID=UPI000A5ACC51|nr:hypothetical protein [Halorubrum coriense]